MSNIEKIQENNEILEECLTLANNLPDAGGEVIDEYDGTVVIE